MYAGGGGHSLTRELCPVFEILFTGIKTKMTTTKKPCVSYMYMYTIIELGRGEDIRKISKHEKDRERKDSTTISTF